MKIKDKFAKIIPDLLYAFLTTIYWTLHPKRENVLILPKKNLWLIVKGNTKFYLDRPQRAWRPLIYHKPYERFFKVEGGDVVLDVGGDIGGTAIRFGQKAGENGLVIAIESNPVRVDCLRANVNNSGLQNIRVVEKGVWNERGTMEYSFDDSSLVEESPQKIEVQVDTLDSICSELNVTDIDFVKINVRKAEIQALEGAEKVLDRAKKVVVATYQTPDGVTTSKVCQILDSHNYKTYVDSGVKKPYAHFVHGFKAKKEFQKR